MKMASASEGKTVRKLILAALVAGRFAATADAANEKTQTLPASSTAPAVSQPAPPAPPPAAAVQPAPQPPPPPKVVEAPWPYNVPSLKPGTGLALAATAANVAPAAGTAKTAMTNPIAATTTPTQLASLPP